MISTRAAGLTAIWLACAFPVSAQQPVFLDGALLDTIAITTPYDTYDKWIGSLKAQDTSFGPVREARVRRIWTEESYNLLRSGRIKAYHIRYRSDGLAVAGFLVQPAPAHDKRYPAVIYNRGGSRTLGLLKFRDLLEFADIASHGYVVVASQYRGNDGGEGREDYGGSDVNDVLNLIPLLDSLSNVDAARIGMYGWSRGGMMTYRALTQTDRIRAAIVASGLVDLFDLVQRRPEIEKNVVSQLIPGWPATKDSAFRRRSAVLWAAQLNKMTPVLLLHGTADWRVHPTQALRMATALYEARHPFRMVLFEGAEHSLVEPWPEVRRLIQFWLDTYVRDGSAWPSLEPHGP
jgi:dipeptidyl aminopeptidase/acylaminoacyl peptidase